MATVAPFLVSTGKGNPTEGELIAENSKLKKEVAALKKENEELKRENAALKSKKRKATDLSLNEPSKKAKTPAQRKKLFEKWAKALARESGKSKITNAFGGDPYTVIVKETIPWTMPDFESIFGGQGGTKIQPTPENKPTSQTTILFFETYDKIKELFGDACIPSDGYKAQSWRQRNFCKSYRQGDLNAELQSLQVHYNKSKQTLQLYFDMHMESIW